ncbi:hypothetical protein KSP40_PGU013432 [Platanthera guangdongensis]|uniref:Uncharacterized protein n=1 Tax=Platanthera guangdongensis TaxID=2320717 RepID=A0ABR2M7E8_9ASPA
MRPSKPTTNNSKGLPSGKVSWSSRLQRTNGMTRVATLLVRTKAPSSTGNSLH